MRRKSWYEHKSRVPDISAVWFIGFDDIKRLYLCHFLTSWYIKDLSEKLFLVFHINWGIFDLMIIEILKIVLINSSKLDKRIKIFSKYIYIFFLNFPLIYMFFTKIQIHFRKFVRGIVHFLLIIDDFLEKRRKNIFQNIKCFLWELIGFDRLHDHYDLPHDSTKPSGLFQAERMSSRLHRRWRVIRVT